MGLTDILIDKVMDQLGITKDTVDKIQMIADNIDTRQEGDSTIIEIKLSKITIVMEN